MSKFSKVLSVLLAMVFVFSTMTIGVEAVSYKDSAIRDYNAIGEPILTTAQYASMALDEVDRMLQEENIKLDIDIGGFIKLNEGFRTIDEALDSVVSIYNRVNSLFKELGDLKDLDFSALLNAPRRGETGEQDADIIKALFQFLADNTDILAKLPYGSDPTNGLSLGLVDRFVDLSEFVDINALIKKPIAKLVWPNLAESELDLTKTLDEYVQTLINEVATGTYPSDKGTIKRVATIVSTYLPGLTDPASPNYIDFLHDSVYDIIAKAVKVAINAVGVVKANQYLPIFLKKFCGYAFTKGKDADGDTTYTRDPANDNINETRVGVVNINFHMDNIDVSDWGTEDIVDHVNDVAGIIVKEVVNPSIKNEINWVNGGNDKLVTNIINTAKVILNHTGNDFFASYVEVKSEAELNAMSEDQFIAYVLRSILNGSIDDVYIDNSIDTMEGVLFELVRSLAATQVPSQNYYSMQPNVDNMISIGLDIAAAALNNVTDMQLSFGLDADEFATACMDWVIEHYEGFVSEYGDNTGWAALSYVFNKIIPADWLPLRDGSPRDDLYDILYTDVIENLINDNLEEGEEPKVKLDAILDLAKRNEDGELNGTVIEVLLHRIVNIVNYIIPDSFPEDEDYDTLEGLLDKELLSSIITGLITGLNDRVETLMPSLLPVVCMALGLSSPASFGDPYVSLEDITTLNPTVTTSFYMYNGSAGINTNTRNKSTGKFKTTPDQLYKYNIVEATTNIPGLNVVYSGSSYINGSEAKTFTFNGVDLTDPAYEGQLLIVTIRYDVYEEEGNKMTTTPLSATTYSVISSVKDDGSNQKRLGASITSLVVKYYEAEYISPTTKLGELADITIDITRDHYTNNRLHTLPADFSVTAATLRTSPGQTDSLAAHGVTTNTSFQVSTTREGGKWEWKPYQIPAAHKNDTLQPGIYQMSFTVHSTGTQERTDEDTVISSHYIVVYDDSGLKGLVNSAVGTNRQQANYASSGSFTAKYTAFEDLNVKVPEGEEGPAPVEVSVNAALAWDRYTAALEEAAVVVYAPRVVNNFGDRNYLDNFAVLAEELYTATKELEACAVSNGVQDVQDALDTIIPPDYVEAYDDNGNPVRDERVEYDDPARTFFGREDYLGYTYFNFKKERKAANSLIDAVKDAEKKGETYTYSPVRAAYLRHRVLLYGGRLIRVAAYQQHLTKALQLYGNIQRGDYSAASWADYTKALAFARQVNAITPDAYYDNPNADNYLFLKNQTSTTTLRQSKINTAREELISAAKKLVVLTNVDYGKLNAAIKAAKATYQAGEANWTALSWSTFTTAYDTAVNLVAQNLDYTDDNQAIVDAAADALNTALAELEEKPAEEGGFYFTDSAEMLTAFVSDMNDNLIITGLDIEDPFVSDYCVGTGGWHVYVEENEEGCESTGAILYFVDDNGDRVNDDEYMIVIFGDVNGDCSIDGQDATQVMSYAFDKSYVLWGDFEDIDESPYGFAADVNHDWMVDGQDASFLKDSAFDFYKPSQAWTYDNDEIYA